MTSQLDMLGAPDVGGTRDKRDRYFTPRWATLALLDYLGDRLAGLVWEPCAGQCHIVDVLRERDHHVLATDITPYPSLDGVHDFLHLERGYAPPAVSMDGTVTVNAPHWIVTNPPYTTDQCTATDIVRHALELATVGVAMLLRLSWLEPCDDRVDLLMTDPPTDYIILPRVNYIGAPSGNNQTSVWCVWDRRRNVGSGGYTRVKHYPADIRKPTYDWRS